MAAVAVDLCFCKFHIRRRLKTVTSGVLASFRSSTYRKVRLGPSLAAALLAFEPPSLSDPYQSLMSLDEMRFFSARRNPQRTQRYASSFISPAALLETILSIP